MDRSFPSTLWRCCIVNVRFSAYNDEKRDFAYIFSMLRYFNSLHDLPTCYAENWMRHAFYPVHAECLPAYFFGLCISEKQMSTSIFSSTGRCLHDLSLHDMQDRWILYSEQHSFVAPALTCAAFALSSPNDMSCVLTSWKPLYYLLNHNMSYQVYMKACSSGPQKSDTSIEMTVLSDSCLISLEAAVYEAIPYFPYV